MMKISMIGILFFVVTSSLISQELPLRVKNLIAVNVIMEEVIYKSKKAVRLKEGEQLNESIAVVDDIQFTDGTIEVELAGRPLPGANSGARGFIGIAFRVSMEDSIRYDCFYLRPTNGRANDQVRRNHSTQYIAHPAFTWDRLRREYPAKYESYVDLETGEWTKLTIEVKGQEARLFVHNAEQPALIIDSLLNTKSSGSVALWIGQGTEGYFRNLTISKQ